MPIERELKFRLAPRAATRAQRDLALDRATRLSSTYYDTPDRALSRARAALRLRRAGSVWLQAFKCERAPGSRGEWEVGAPAGSLDLARLPIGEIRRASAIDLAPLQRRLRPLFETRFTRRVAQIRYAGAAIEVALDRGEVVAGPRRERILELEVELKSGSSTGMLRYAQSLVEPLGLQLSLESKAERGYRLALGETGAPRRWQSPKIADATPAQALSRLASAALEQIAANAHGVVDSEDPEYLHQLRVGMRRLRAFLNAFCALEPQVKPIRRRLREFGPVLGAARDWDVLASSLRSAPEKAIRARNAVRALVASPPFNETLVRMLRWIEEAPWHNDDRALAAFAADALDRLRRKATKAIDWSDAAERHALRIRVKRLRYAADAFAECFPGASTRSYIAALERLQDDFGELNDIAVARRLLDKTGPDRREKGFIARVSRDWSALAERAPFWRAGK